MKAEIKVPAMGESISSATIGAILKPTGSHVEADEEVLELETDKVNQVLYAPQAGIITLAVSPQEVVKIGQVVGFVETEAAAKTEVQETKPQSPPKPAPKPESKPETKPEPAPKPETKPETKPEPASTSQRKPESKAEIAAAQSVEKGGARLTKEAYVANLLSTEAQPPKPERRETRRKMSKVRRIIADRLVQVQQTTASLTTFNEVDMSQILLLREKYKELFTKEHGVKLGFMSFFIKAVVSALQAFPDFNSYIEGDEIVHREYCDIGVAVGTDKGLFVPVVRDCDRLTYPEIEMAILEYAKKAREGRIAADDLVGGGFTITNGGVYGSLLSTPILNPPQCAILGMHKIEKRVIVVEDQMVIRPMMYLALTYDHRLVDGKEAVSFLIHTKNQLEDPTRQVLHV